MRRFVFGLLAMAAIVGIGVGIYARYFRATVLAETPTFEDTGDRLPTQEEFESLAKSDPVKLLEACLARYQREVNGGITATLEKRERVHGDPKPPKEPPVEIIRLLVRNDVAGEGETAHPQVRMAWESGARRSLIGTVTGTLFVEEHGGGKDKITAWVGVAIPTPVSGPLAKKASRYCIADAGLYRAMLRSHTVWKKRQDDKVLNWRFVEKRAVPEVGGRVCFVIERTCPTPEVDPFEIGGEPNIRDGEDPADVGSVRITLYIDAERWLQVGSELHRKDGHLLAAYYFRDIDLKPKFADDAFTTEGLKKAVAEVKK